MDSKTMVLEKLKRAETEGPEKESWCGSKSQNRRARY